MIDRQRRLAVLVVDDSEEIRTAVSYCLESLGYDVTCGSTGKEAVQLLKDRYFDLIITDLIMPDSDGLDVIREIRKRHPSARIFVGFIKRNLDAIRTAFIQAILDCEAPTGAKSTGQRTRRLGYLGNTDRGLGWLPSSSKTICTAQIPRFSINAQI